MAVLATLTTPGGAVGDTSAGKRIPPGGVIDAVAGVYAWVDDLASVGAAQEITADPAPAVIGAYVATYPAAGAFTLPTLATVNVGDKIELTNVDGTAITVTPAAGEVLNGAADRTFLSDSARQMVVAEKISATEWAVGPNVVTTATYSRMVINYTAATGAWPNAGTAPIGANADPQIIGSQFSLDGNTIVVRAGGRVRLTGPQGGFFSGNGSNRHYFAEEGQTTRYEPTGATNTDGYAVDVEATGGIGLTPQVAVLEFTPATETRIELYSDSSNNTFQLGPAHGAITCETLPVDVYQAGTLLPAAGPDHWVFNFSGTAPDLSQSFTPTVSGRYRYQQLLRATSHQAFVSLATVNNAAPGAADVLDNDAALRRLSSGRTSTTDVVNLVAGTTYYLSYYLGGGTTQADMDVVIEYMDHAQVVRAEDLRIMNPPGTAGQTLQSNGDGTASWV